MHAGSGCFFTFSDNKNPDPGKCNTDQDYFYKMLIITSSPIQIVALPKKLIWFKIVNF